MKRVVARRGDLMQQIAWKLRIAAGIWQTGSDRAYPTTSHPVSG